MNRNVHHNSPSPAQGDGRYALLIVVAAALSAGAIGLLVGALGTSLPALHSRLHTPLSELGILIGINFFGSLIATLTLGPLLDRRPAKPFMAGGMLVAALGLAFLPLASNLPMAIAALGLAGLGGGMNSIGSAVLTTRLYGQQGGRALSWINMSFGLGAFSGPLIAAAALNTLHDYRLVFAGIAVVMLVPALLFALLPLPDPLPHVEAGAPEVPRASRLAVALLAAVSFLYLGAEVGFGGWAFTYVRQTSPADTATASLAPAGFWLAISLGSVGAALRPRAVRAEWLIFACGLGSAGAALGFLSLPSVGFEIVAATLFGLCLGPIYPLNLACAAGLVPRAAGRIAALVIACSQLGGTLLPWVQGHLLARGPAWGASLTVCVCLLLSLLQLVFVRARRITPSRHPHMAQAS